MNSDLADDDRLKKEKSLWELKWERDNLRINEGGASFVETFVLSNVKGCELNCLTA